MPEGGEATLIARVDNPPQGSDLVLTLSNGETLTIPEGETQGSATFVVQEDDPYLDAGVYSVSITGANGGNYEDLDTSDTATVTVEDTIDPVYANISVDQPSVPEGATLTYTVELKDAEGNPVSVPAGTSVTVALGWSGAASGGSDTGALPTSVTIPAGSGAYSFEVDALDDYFAEGSEPLVATITSVTETGDVFEHLDIGTATAESAIVDEDNPDAGDTVTIKLFAVVDGELMDANAVNEGEKAFYVAHALDSEGNIITDDAGGDVAITFTDGSAVFDADYSSITTRVGLGEEFNAQALQDTVLESDETFTVGVSDYSNADAYEQVAYGDDVTTTILDDEPRVESVEGAIVVNSNVDVQYLVLSINGQTVDLSADGKFEDHGGGQELLTVNLTDYVSDPDGAFQVDLSYNDPTGDSVHVTEFTLTATLSDGSSRSVELLGPQGEFKLDLNNKFTQVKLGTEDAGNADGLGMRADIDLNGGFEDGGGTDFAINEQVYADPEAADGGTA